MFHIVLFQPEIPPNTGNIMRLCANTGAQLHLIRPLGFSLNEKRLRRAGLDYRDYAKVREYDNLDAFTDEISPSGLYAFSTHAATRYSDTRFKSGDALLFGPETRGLPHELLDSLPAEHKLRLPMRPDSRSLNLSNSVAVVVYEAWRQLEFAGGN